MVLFAVTLATEILRACRRGGADVAFGVPGVHNLEFWTTSRGDDLPRVINVRHEQTCVYAADGWARATGRLGLGLVTTGPGAANTLGAFGEAAASGSPVLLIASEISTTIRSMGLSASLHQSAGQATMFSSLAKHTFELQDMSDAESVGRAIALATSFPTGPVYLSVPNDLLAEDGPVISTSPAGEVEMDQNSVARAASLIDKSSNIAIWAGGGVIQSRSERALGRLALLLRAPVFTSFGGRGALAPTHPCLVGLPPHEPEIEEYLASAEILVALGTRFDGPMTMNGAMRLPPTVINVNVAPESNNLRGPTCIDVVGDCAQVIREIIRRVSPKRSGPVDGLPELRSRVWDRLRRDPNATQGAQLVAAVEAAVNRNTVVICDMTIPGYWIAGYLSPQRSRTFQYAIGWGTLGYAVPAAIGAAHASRDGVLAICGDGGLMFGLGELATIAEHRLPIVVLLFDDGGYGMLRFDLERSDIAPTGMDLYTPDFVALADAFGIDAEVVVGLGPDLSRQIRDALRGRKPKLLVASAALRPPRTTSPRWREPL